MADALRAVRPWVTFAGCVLVVCVLYWAQAVIVPVVLAGLLSFLLTPVVTALQRRIGRIPAVLLVVTLTFVGLGVGAWGVTRQLGGLAQELPSYRQNIRQKVRDIRWASRGGAVEQVQKTVDDIRAEIDKGAAPAAGGVVVHSGPDGGLWGYGTTIGPLVGSLGTAGLVVVLVILILLDRQELRNRLVRLLGHGQLPATTRALDEAATRVSRYLLVHSVVNLFFGAGVGLGLYAIGVPYALLWGFLAAALRFIPFIGAWIGVLAPTIISLAVFPGWLWPAMVVALFIVLELFTNLVVETIFYAGAAGVTKVGLLVAIIFWTWLWGPLGLLLATPLTVCVIVLGKHVPALEFIATLMSDAPAVDADLNCYQRLLAGDYAEAAEIVEQHIKGGAAAETAYDKVMLPALNYAERDRLEGRLSRDEEHAVIAATRDLLEEVAAPVGNHAPSEPVAAGPAPAAPIAVLGCAANGEGDAVALKMLDHLLDGTPYTLDIVSEHALFSDIVDKVQAGGYRAVCIADLPPSPPARSRHLVKRLRASAPEVKLLVGRWAPPSLADEDFDRLRDAGADRVAHTLLELRDQLYDLLPVTTR